VTGRPPLDELAEGLATFAADGRLLSANAAMRALVSACGADAASFAVEDLPLGTSARALLLRGEEVAFDTPVGRWRLQVCALPDGRWLVARPPAAASAPELARSRLLAGLAGSFVHELANRVAVVVGFGDLLELQLPAGEREQLQGMLAGAQESLRLLRSMVQLLDRSPRAAAPTPLAEPLQDAVELLGKHAQRLGRALSVAAPGPTVGDAPAVRCVPAEAVQAITTAALPLLRTGAGPLQFAVVRTTADGRRCACVRIADRGDVEVVRHLQQLLAADPAGVETARRALPGSGDLAVVAFGLRRAGGDLLAGIDGDGARRVELRWPEAQP
jgi:signal transduction histidine kinase